MEVHFVSNGGSSVASEISSPNNSLVASDLLSSSDSSLPTADDSGGNRFSSGGPCRCVTLWAAAGMYSSGGGVLQGVSPELEPL